jgi:hypothetical protein
MFFFSFLHPERRMGGFFYVVRKFKDAEDYNEISSILLKRSSRAQVDLAEGRLVEVSGR